MTKERFTEIMKEYGHTDEVIYVAWDKRPSDSPSEEVVRTFAEALSYYFKDILEQE